MITYSDRTTGEKIDSPMLSPYRCEQRCCLHWGIGRRVCCRCGAVRIERAAEPARAAP